MSPRARDIVDGFLADLRGRHDDGTIGAATLRQRVAFLEDLLAYVEHAHGHDGGTSTAAPAPALFDPPTCQAWLEAVAQGHRRRRATSSGNRHGSTATIRAAAASLRALAGWANVPLETTPHPRQPARPHLDANHLHHRCTNLFEGPRPHRVTSALWIRTHALVRVVIDTGARVGEIAAMTVHDLADHPPRARVTPRPPGTGTPEPPRTTPLDARTARALRAWTRERTRLTTALEGGPVHALWVTTVPHRAGGPLRPAGLPIGARALEGAWERLRAALTEARAGHPDPSPPPDLLTDWRPSPPN
ncbi:tyrosine-type recombinase/integrase [Embleya scabrispora]|uniref:tyrosine-type recombinase/integrase n=1 Tax=Embleya scabrispora TaxID=159449 RepID=UPI00037542F9|nr:tyrosine-type recombinase/integrase [Embleya scabrispora]MYS87872.1 hypothetical protein [Streptomyces sp. SID5474]